MSLKKAGKFSNQIYPKRINFHQSSLPAPGEGKLKKQIIEMFLD
jgi:hypothetical protein